MKSRNLGLYTAALALIAAITGCILDREAKGGSIVENEATAGTLYTEAGAPAVGAVVKAVPVDYVPNKAFPKSAADSSVIRTFKTDANGRYNLKTLPPGQYNIFGELDGAHSFLDSLVIGKNEKPIPSDTLKEPGSITGIVLMEPNHDPRKAFIQVLGTNVFSNVDSAGRFTLRNLARGAYSFKAITTLAEYTPYFGGFTVREGKDDTLADTIRLVFTGIPIVRNLHATYDTSGGAVHIAWSPVKYGFFKEYLIYRTDASSSSPSLVPIAKVTDTTYLDDLAGQGLQAGDGMPAKEYEYRVQVRSKELDVGPPFESALVKAASRNLVRTVLNLSFLDAQTPRVRILDTFRIALNWSNPSRGNDFMQWDMEGAGSPLKVLSLKGMAGADTLIAVAPPKAGNYSITARIRDEAGDSWTSQLQIQVIVDAPIADAGKDTLVSPSDQVFLHGKASQTFGSVAKWEWDIGNTGTFSLTKSGDTTYTSGSGSGTRYNVFRVTDDRGTVSLDTMKVTVIDDLPTANAGFDTTVTLSDTVWLRGSGTDKFGKIVRKEWDIGNTGHFIEVSKDTAVLSRPDEGYQYHVLRVTDDDGGTAMDTLKVTIRDDIPVASLTVKNRIASEGGGYTLSSTVKDLGRIVKWEWDPGTGAFSPGGKDTSFVPAQPALTEITCRVKVTDDDGSSGIATVKINVSKWKIVSESPLPGSTSSNYVATALDGKFYVFGGYTYAGQPLGLLYSYDPNTDQWTKRSPLPFPMLASTMVAANGKLLVFASCAVSKNCGDPSAKLVYEYNPKLDEWSTRASMPNGCEQCGAVSVGSKIYLLNRTKAEIDEYDPLSETWTLKGKDENLLMFAAADAKIRGVTVNLWISEYDPIAGVWNEQIGRYPAYLKDESIELPTSAVSIGPKVYFLGSFNSSAQEFKLKTVVYDPATKSVEQKSNALLAELGPISAVINGKIYSLGSNLWLQSYDPADDP